MKNDLKYLIEKIPEIVKAAISVKNKARWAQLFEKGSEMKTEIEEFIEELIGDAGVCAQLILEIFQDSALSEEGVDLSVHSRDMKRAIMEAAMKNEIAKHL